MAEAEPLPEWVVRFIVPVFVAILAALLGQFLASVVERYQRRRTNQEQQIEMATETVRRVVDIFDELYGEMKYSAWQVAWRMALHHNNNNTQNALLQESDQEKWAQYNAVLNKWRKNLITDESDLGAFFGVSGSEAEQFREISALFEDAATKLWNIAYASRAGDSITTIEPSAWGGETMPRREKDLTETDQMVSRGEFDVFLEEVRDMIQVMAQKMIFCIQKQYIGTMRLSGEPNYPPKIKEAPPRHHHHSRDKMRTTTGGMQQPSMALEA